MSTLITSTAQIGTIKDAGGNETAMTIDSAGRVLKPVIPAWRVCLTASQTITTSGGSGTDILWNDTSSTDFNFLVGGCTLSSGVITVPVDGIYQCNAAVRFDNVGSSSYMIMRILKNNIQSAQQELYVINGNNHSTDYNGITGSDVFSCVAGDTLRVSAMTSADTNWEVNLNGSKFSGYLIG